MEKTEFIEKARAAGAGQSYIDWAIAFHEEKDTEGFSMPYEALLDEFVRAKNSVVE